MADNKDKITMQDYLDFFGGKSAEADVVLEELTRQIEDQRFGRVMSSKDYKNEQLAAAMSDEELMNLTMGLVGGGGGLKAAGQAIRRGGKNILDIFREMMGRGKGEVGDIAFRRGSQPSQYTPSIIEKPLGQQELFSQEPVKQAVRRALQLPKQEVGTNLPALRMKQLPKEGQIRSRFSPLPKEGQLDITETLEKITRLQDEVAKLGGRVVGGPLFRRTKK